MDGEAIISFKNSRGEFHFLYQLHRPTGRKVMMGGDVKTNTPQPIYSLPAAEMDEYAPTGEYVVLATDPPQLYDAKTGQMLHSSNLDYLAGVARGDDYPDDVHQGIVEHFLDGEDFDGTREGGR